MQVDKAQAESCASSGSYQNCEAESMHICCVKIVVARLDGKCCVIFRTGCLKGLKGKITRQFCKMDRR